MFLPILAWEVWCINSLWAIWLAKSGYNVWRTGGAALLIHVHFMQEFEQGTPEPRAP